MKHFRTTMFVVSVTVATAAAIAQTPEPPPTSRDSRRQSGTVGPPLDAASMNAPAASAAAPLSTSTPTAPATTAPAQPVAPVQPAVESEDPPKVQAPAPRTGRAARMASGRVTDAEPGALPTRPDRN